MQRLAFVAILMILMAPVTGFADGEKKELGAHEHGHGSLDIAIEENMMAIELHAPGADLAGFEHVPSSNEDKAAVAEVLAALDKPLTLFVPPAAAGCQAVEREVETEHEGDHMEFHATYQIECDDIAVATGLDIIYFDRFPNAEELDVQISSGKGQSSAEVTRDAPRLDLENML